MSEVEGELVNAQRFQPDAFFTAKQQARLQELMERFHEAQAAGQDLPAAEKKELERLVDAEWRAAIERGSAHINTWEVRMAKKPYSPIAPYAELKRVEGLINEAQTIDDIRKIVVSDGPKIGYKAFCYILGGRMTPEAMKPDEACAHAAQLEEQGQEEEAELIYQKVRLVHPDHPLTKQ